MYQIINQKNKDDGDRATKKNILNESGISDHDYQNKRVYYEDFKDFYLFAHEYLALACNSKDRLSLV